MQRRDFLRYSGLLGAVTTFKVTSENAQAQNAAAPAVSNPSAGAPIVDAPTFGLNGAPVVGHTTAESTTITWAVQGPSTVWVEYGETPELGKTAMPSMGGLHPYESLVQRVQIRGLKAGTRYYYRAHSCEVQFNNAYSVKRGETLVSTIGSFKTLDPKAQSASFVIWNDTHDQRQTLSTLHSLTSEIAPDFLFINGDVSNDVSSEEKTVSLFLNPYDLPFAQNYPLFFCRGNHDVRGRAARTLPNFVSVPNNEFHYSFRQGPLAVLVMDTGEDKPDTHPVYAGLVGFDEYRTQQRQWLEQEIQKPEFRKAPFRVLFCHIPLWWKEETGGSVCVDGRQKWHDLLVKAGIHLVVSGHTHEFLHLPPTAQHSYHQLIGGGPKPEAATIISGQVQGNKMNVAMKDLNGKLLADLTFKA